MDSLDPALFGAGPSSLPALSIPAASVNGEMSDLTPLPSTAGELSTAEQGGGEFRAPLPPSNLGASTSGYSVASGGGGGGGGGGGQKRRRRRRRSDGGFVTSDEDGDFKSTAGGRTRAAAYNASLPKPSKIKLNFATSQHSLADSGVGWDRELDSDEEALPLEEHFLLRVPPNIATEFGKRVEKRTVQEGGDVWFKFKDSRRAVFHHGNRLYSAKLVDLPSIIESHRLTAAGAGVGPPSTGTKSGAPVNTGGFGQAVKVCDISQMLVVEETIRNEDDATRGNFNVEDFVWPHGITPPLKHVRKRRFRRRVNKRTIEAIEKAVENLLEADTQAEKVEYGWVSASAADAEEEENGPSQPAQFGLYGPSRSYRTALEGPAATPAPGEDGDGSDADGEKDGSGSGSDDGGGFDSDLEAEINRGLQEVGSSDSDSDKSEEEEEGSDGEPSGAAAAEAPVEDEEEEFEDVDEDPEAIDMRRRYKLLEEEVGGLEKAIVAKEAELKKALNPIFKKRFLDTIKKLQSDRDSKRSQQATLTSQLEAKREAVRAEHARIEAEERRVVEEKLEKEKEKEEKAAAKEQRERDKEERERAKAEGLELPAAPKAKKAAAPKPKADPKGKAAPAAKGKATKKPAAVATPAGSSPGTGGSGTEDSGTDGTGSDDGDGGLWGSDDEDSDGEEGLPVGGGAGGDDMQVDLQLDDVELDLGVGGAATEGGKVVAGAGSPANVDTPQEEGGMRAEDVAID